MTIWLTILSSNKSDTLESYQLILLYSIDLLVFDQTKTLNSSTRGAHAIPVPISQRATLKVW